jgi:CheY-like chemotaxis protein
MRTMRSLLDLWTPPGAPDPSALRLLVVDDEAPVLSYVNRILTRTGYAPALASNGADALAVAATMGGIDLLVTDLAMPKMSGIELAKKLRQSFPAMKVLYQTGFSDRLFAQQTQLRDGEAFLEKPYSVAGFEQAIALLVYGTIRVGTARPVPSTTPVA